MKHKKHPAKWDGWINCFEAHADGSLTLYLETNTPTESTDAYGCMAVTIEAGSVKRMMYAALDALTKEASRR